MKLTEVLFEYRKRNIPLPARMLYETKQDWLRKAIKYLEAAE